MASKSLQTSLLVLFVPSALWDLFDIDFFKCQGEFFFGEMNLRIGASGTAISQLGVNLPAMFVMSMLGEGTNGFKKEITSSAMYVNERMCVGDWLAGMISTKTLRKILNSWDIKFVKDEDDDRPQKVFDKRIWHHYFNCKRIVRRIKYIVR